MKEKLGDAYRDIINPTLLYSTLDGNSTVQSQPVVIQARPSEFRQISLSKFQGKTHIVMGVLARKKVDPSIAFGCCFTSMNGRLEEDVKEASSCRDHANSVPSNNRVGGGGKDWENKFMGDEERLDIGDVPIHVADAIAYLLHIRKCIHRDFKPMSPASYLALSYKLTSIATTIVSLVLNSYILHASIF